MKAEIKVGDKHDMPWPFYRYESISGGAYEPNITNLWASGCALWFEQNERFIECNAEGVISYEVLAVVDIGARLQKRVIVRSTKTDPDSNKYGGAKVVMLTEKMYLNHISSSPFRADYEINEDLNSDEIYKMKQRKEVF